MIRFDPTCLPLPGHRPHAVPLNETADQMIGLVKGHRLRGSPFLDLSDTKQWG